MASETTQNTEHEIYNDLKEKYDALSQQFVTMGLEKGELVQEMKRMRQKNAELTELEKYEHEEIEQFKQFTKPLFQGSIESMSIALCDADFLKETMGAQNDSYKNLNNILRHEIDTLKAQNKEYQSTLQAMKINQQKKENESKHKIELLKAELEDINLEENDIYDKYKQLENEYNILKQETDQQLQIQMEVTTPIPGVGAVISDDKSLHISFVRSTGKLLPERDSKSNLPLSYYMQTYASNPKIQIIDYDSAQSLPGIGFDYDLNECGTDLESIDEEHLDHTETIDHDENAATEEKMIESNNNNKDKQKELEDVILNMGNSIKQKDKAIEALKLTMDKKDENVEKLNKQIAQLSAQNDGALSQQSNLCFGFKWFE